jgi:hypothetical protein
MTKTGGRSRRESSARSSSRRTLRSPAAKRGTQCRLDPARLPDRAKWLRGEQIIGPPEEHVSTLCDLVYERGATPDQDDLTARFPHVVEKRTEPLQLGIPLEEHDAKLLAAL